MRQEGPASEVQTVCLGPAWAEAQVPGESSVSQSGDADGSGSSRWMGGAGLIRLARTLSTSNQLTPDRRQVDLLPCQRC